MSPAVEEERMTQATDIALNRRLESPNVNRIPIGSNNDDVERAEARAARVAAVRRNPAVAAAAPKAVSSDADIFGREQIMDMLQNCIKLASENKINQKNTWDLNLIDHLSDIIKFKPEDDDAGNTFQKASCSLEAGVKIYSTRVDSLYSEAYKVLGGFNRVGREEENESTGDKSHAHVGTGKEEDVPRKKVEKKPSPLSTLETSWEALNVKKFDVAFTVDPLYHQTSAQFDEGGARGLLLNNLGVYGDCRVLFDSFEVPERFALSDSQNDKDELIDLSFCKEFVDQMLINVPKQTDISPTLREMMNLYGDNKQRQQNLHPDEEQTVDRGETNDNHHNCMKDVSFDDFDAGNFDHDDHLSVVDDNSTRAETSFTTHPEEVGDYSYQSFNTSIKIEEIADFLSYGLGFTSKTNAWAGPDFWKYKKSKGLEQVPCSVENQEQTANKRKVKKLVSDIEFTKFLEKDYSNIFEPPKNPKSLLLLTNKASCKFTLPEDFHYKPESLTKLFLLPEIMFLGKKARKLNAVDELGERNDDFAPTSWDRESFNDDNCDDGISNGCIDDTGNLVHLPRQVNKVTVQYDKESKQVDVHALKEKLWMHIQETVDTEPPPEQDMGREGSVSLARVIRSLERTSSPDALKGTTPHLFFICLLHLANEHGLALLQSVSLDDVTVQIPQSGFTN